MNQFHILLLCHYLGSNILVHCKSWILGIHERVLVWSTNQVNVKGILAVNLNVDNMKEFCTYWWITWVFEVVLWILPWSNPRCRILSWTTKRGWYGFVHTQLRQLQLLQWRFETLVLVMIFGWIVLLGLYSRWVWGLGRTVRVIHV